MVQPCDTLYTLTLSIVPGWWIQLFVISDGVRYEL